MNEIWPTAQLGVNALGTLRGVVPAPWLVEWNAYVSNGRTPGPVDPTEAKMVGGGIAASTTRPHPMTFGASFMLGEYSDQQHDFDVITEETSRPERIAYAEQGEGKREESWLPGVYQANRLEWAIYGLGTSPYWAHFAAAELVMGL